MKMAGTYVQLSREEFEDWLDSLGFRGKWRLKPGRGGVYQLPLSDTVAIEINSTTGSGSEVMNRGRASMKLRLVSRVTGHTLNKKSMGQSHFKRTVNWRDTWKKGVERMKAAYLKAKSFYDALAEIEDRSAYKFEMLNLIESQPRWQENDFLQDLHKKVQDGGILTQKQKDAITRNRSRSQRQPEPENVTYDEHLVARMRQLWVAAKRSGDDWTMDFVQSVAEQVKSGRSLSPRQKEVLDDKLKQYRVASVRPGTVRVASLYAAQNNIPFDIHTAFNKYNPNELLSQLVEILEKYELEDAVEEVKRLTPKVQKAWRSRER